MKVNKLTADKWYLCFIYDYIPTRNPLTLDDFRPIMNTLDRLHENTLQKMNTFPKYFDSWKGTGNVSFNSSVISLISDCSALAGPSV